MALSRQIADLGARVGQNLLARAVIEFLGNLERLRGRPAEAGAAQLLERGQVVQPGRALASVLDTHPERTREAPRRLEHLLRRLAFENAPLRRVPASATPPPSACAVATTSKYPTGTKSRISISRRHAIARVGVLTRPMPITPFAPRPSVTVAVRGQRTGCRSDPPAGRATAAA